MNIFITTCSAKKIQGGKGFLSYGWHNEKRGELLKRRSRVLRMMENKIVPSSLKIPFEGPDFGGTAEEGLYLPAYRRYSQGSFVQGLITSECKLNDWGKRNRLYFISALYGLAQFNEPIQNYDLRLDQPILSEKWKENGLLTSVLIRDLSCIKGEIFIIDCCVNEIYRSLIDWAKIRNAGYAIRHAVSNGQLDETQVRWTCGHLAGENPSRLFDLFEYEECQYTADNGSIVLRKSVPDYPLPESLNQPREGGTAAGIVRPSIAVAVHRPSQKETFMIHAKNQGWLDATKFEFIDNLRKETLVRLDKHGMKLLIIHVDDTHADIQKAYKAKSQNLVGDLPEGWHYRKVKNGKYSDIQFEYKIDFSI
jgi:hypothetical protein